MAKRVVLLITDPACAQSQGIANAILGALFRDDELCFIIAPNPRNAPIRLQTFGDKLGWQNRNIEYQKRSGGYFSVTHLTETKLDAAASVTELVLCRYIIEHVGVRYLGNFDGAVDRMYDDVDLRVLRQEIAEFEFWRLWVCSSSG
ncbi:hypothetical protein [Sorangium sp. So ce394]|uniref:hypothetical protein n=1 Tax=Sorangium sp. So ce394 TaxID=3133310 RepID=UPI003F5C15AB